VFRPCKICNEGDLCMTCFKECISRSFVKCPVCAEPFW
jgi:hypothetical protein